DLPSALRPALITALADYLRAQRWYGGKAETLVSLEIPVAIPLETDAFKVFLLIVRVQFQSDRIEQYALPVMMDPAEGRIRRPTEAAQQAALEPYGEVALTDALEDARFAGFLLDCIRREASIEAGGVRLVARSTPALARIIGASAGSLAPSVTRAEQSNTSVRFGSELMLKFLRRPEEGVNLDVEMGLFLTERARFKHTPPIAGWMELQNESSMTVAVLQGFVENQGDAWKHTLEALDGFFARTADSSPPRPEEYEQGSRPAYAPEGEPPNEAKQWIGSYLSSATLLGQRTAELHCALCSDSSDPEFAPETFTLEARQSAAREMEHLAARAFSLLAKRLEILPASFRSDAAQVLSRQQEIVSHFHRLESIPGAAVRTRIHGDYHLGQTLFTGDDFFIIDFEGEPERPLAERRAKRSPLCDVAGMLRSFHYAERTALRSYDPLWGKYWIFWVSGCFLQGYLRSAQDAAFVPGKITELYALLEIFLLEKAVYELLYEIRNRPAWASIPLDGILRILN
ncbi:MAG: putative maltokinase, partial [Acidobacteriota bacterium]|nr:putative maltokinase [Acidobacteriota bacterium]